MKEATINEGQRNFGVAVARPDRRDPPRIAPMRGAAGAAAESVAPAQGRYGLEPLRWLTELVARAAVAANADRHARKLAPVIADIRASGASSLRAIAGELNDRGMLTRRGGRWHVSTVINPLDRLGGRHAPVQADVAG